MQPEIINRGENLSIRFNSFEAENYEYFLKAKALPESLRSVGKAGNFGSAVIAEHITRFYWCKGCTSRRVESAGEHCTFCRETMFVEFYEPQTSRLSPLMLAVLMFCLAVSLLGFCDFQPVAAREKVREVKER